MGLTIAHCGPMFRQGDLSERWSRCRTWISGTLSTPMQVHALLGAMQNTDGMGQRFGAAIVMDKAWPKPKLRSDWNVTNPFKLRLHPLWSDSSARTVSVRLLLQGFNDGPDWVGEWHKRLECQRSTIMQDALKDNWWSELLQLPWFN